MRAAADVLAAALLLTGSLVTLLGAIGAIRFPDFYSRAHAIAKAQSLGFALVLVGAALRLTDVGDAAKLLLIVVFQFLTSPVAAHMVARAAHRRGLDHPERDELAERRERGRAEVPREAATGRAAERDTGPG